MSLGSALARDLANLLSLGLVLLVVLPLLAVAVGWYWYCGDCFDTPTVTVNYKEQP